MSNKLPIETQCALFKFKKPYQYIGEEYLAYNKDFDKTKIKMVFAFPDKYEVAISNLGQKILYDIVNSNQDMMADRVYAPENDYREWLKETNKELISLESKKPIKEFDIVGFSLQYELAYPTMLEMLRLAKIPVKNEDRTDDMPIITAGGPCCYNPRPIQNFIDIFMIGDGEEVLPEIIKKYYELKETGLKRKEIIKELTKIEGVFAPQEENKTKKRIYDISKDKRILRNPIPYSSGIHDRTVIEIRRGCGRMCRFCQAGHINLPIRERKSEDIIEMVEKSTLSAGYNEYSLLSLSSNDYGNIEPLIEQLSKKMDKKKISVSLPSQRIDKYSQRLAELVNGVRATTVTLAPEAGSQRLRNVINKNLTEEQIIETILNCYKKGVSTVKLYFMIGLPTETYKDLDEMAELFSKIKYMSKQIKKENELKDSLNLTCTVSIFVPKPFTPFQWCKQESQESIREKIKYLQEKVKPIKGIKLNYHNSFISKLECALTRGDKKYNEFFIKLNEKGVYLSSWDENIDKALWEETAKECGFNIDEEAQKEYNTDEILPWDIIDIGIDKDWLKEQYNKAKEEKNITPCEFNCVKCGVCKNFKTKKVIDKPFKKDFDFQEEKEERTANKYRIKITKENEMRYISHLDWQNTIIKMLYRSGLDINFSQGYNPTPKISLGIALPIFTESLCELIDIEIYNEPDTEQLIKTLNKVLPENIKVISAQKIDKNTPAIDITAQWALYSFEPLKKGILKKEDLLYIKERISSSNEIFIEKINKKGIKKLVNIKKSIKSADIDGMKLYMVLKTGQTPQNGEQIPSVKPQDIIRLYEPDTEFRIIRQEFYDINMQRM